MPVEVFEAIAQPKRREILRLLSGRELSAGEIASKFAVTQPAISQHLKVLKDVGLLSERREGTRRMLSVQAEGLTELHDFLAAALPANLDRLKEGLAHRRLKPETVALHRAGWHHYLARLALAASGNDPGHDSWRDVPLDRESLRAAGFLP